MSDRNDMSESIVRMLQQDDREMEELRRLRLLKKNLESGVIVQVDRELIELLMQKDWRSE